MKKSTVLGLIIIVIGILIAAYPIKLSIENKLEQRKLKSAFEQNKEKNVENKEKIIYDKWPETLMKIPEIDMEAIVVEMEEGNGDIFAEDVNYPPAHYVTTDYPGGESNVAIAAHRTGPADYFRNLDKLKKGDNIILETKKATHEYIVEKVFITDPTNIEVIAPTDYSALTLTSCESADGISNKKRIIVRAKLKEN